MKFTIFQESRIGKRKTNQDRQSYCYSREALLMVVADGMGGHLYGEIAAQIAVDTLTASFQREALPRLPDPFLFLSLGLSAAHRAIGDYTRRHELPDAPRTTCVACVVQDNVAYWAHAGDSRLYVIRDRRILTQTRDHSRVQALLDQGVISAEEAQQHPSRNRVYSCLGGPVAPQVDLSRKTTLQAGDVIALCSDGVWGPLDETMLVATLAEAQVTAAVPQLIDAAEARAGESCDNCTMIALNWQDSYDVAAPSERGDTLVMADHTLTTDTLQLEGFGPPSVRERDLTEEEIDRAIEQIRGVIKKYSRQESSQ